MTDVHSEAPMTGAQDNAPQNTATASYTANSNYDLDNRIDTSSPFVNANEIRAYVSSDLLQQASFKSVKIKHTDSLNDGSFTSRSRAPKRRGAVSGRSTNTVLSEDGAFLTEVWCFCCGKSEVIQTSVLWLPQLSVLNLYLRWLALSTVTWPFRKQC